MSLLEKISNKLGYVILPTNEHQKTVNELNSLKSKLNEKTNNVIKDNSQNPYQIINERDIEIKNLTQVIKSRDEQINHLRLHLPMTDETYFLRDEFKQLPYSGAAVQKALDDYDFKTVLDIGAGAMAHSEAFAKHGKLVTAVDFGVSIYYQKHTLKSGIEINQIIGDFNLIDFPEKYDCAWASHVLEHQPNVDGFLKKLVSLVNENGVIAITVPPLKHEIVGGHVSLWNAGLVLYRLVLAGVDCSSASVLSTGYNISVIVTKKSIIPEGIEFDSGDIRRIKKYLPRNLDFIPNENDDPFNGNITRLNW